ARLSFEVCDALALSTLTGPYDVITSFNALHWVQQQNQVLHDIFNLLAPRGLAFIQMVGHGERKSLEHVIREVCHRPEWAEWAAEYARPYDHVAPETYRALAEEAGFTAEVTLEPFHWDFKSRSAFAKWAEATFQYWTKHLPPGQADRFINDVL